MSWHRGRREFWTKCRAAFMLSCGEAAESRDDIFFVIFLMNFLWTARGLLAGGREFFLDFVVEVEIFFVVDEFFVSGIVAEVTFC